MKLDYAATDTGSDGDDSGNDDGGHRVSNSKKLKREKEDCHCEIKPRFSQMKIVMNRANNQIKRCNGSSQVKNEDSDHKFFLAEFDDYVSSEKLSYGVSDTLRYGFEIGDMVWGKVKSHPWWPGYIFNEAFASLSVRRMRKKIGHVLVAFFGDDSYGWFDPSELIPFESNFVEKSQQKTCSSIDFAKAVEEAMDEVGRRSALGLTCKCRNVSNFKPTNVEGYFAVDVLEAVYSAKQIKKARESFSSAQTLSFVKLCALAPYECDNDSDSLKFLKKKATVYAFRRAVFEEFDETYEQAFRARSSLYTSVKMNERYDKATSQVIAEESLGDLKISRNDMKVKESTGQFSQVQVSSQLQGIKGSLAGDHVLQRRTPYLQTHMKHELPELVSVDFTSSNGGDTRGKVSSAPKLSRDNDKYLAQESEVRMGKKASETGTHSRSSKDSLKPILEGKSSAGDENNKVNVLQRSFEEMDSENALNTKKRKKKESWSELKKSNQNEKKRLNISPLVSTRNQSGLVPSMPKPTMLVMRFPHGSSLPSTALLKARFSRFGLLDQSAIRVFSKSSICRVVFLYKLDAQTALRYASRSKSLFGNVNVTCFLRDVKACSASEFHKPTKKAKTDEPLNQWLEPTTLSLVPTISSQNYKAKPVVDNIIVDHVEPPLEQSQCTVVDISEEMMKLLLRCNDVVANVKGLFGYVPYHCL